MPESKPWEKWVLVYKCRQCEGFLKEKPGPAILAAMDTLSGGGTEPTQGNMLQAALDGMAPKMTAHECDRRSVGIADLTGVIREGSNIVVVS